MGFVRNLIGHIYLNFYEDDIIIVTSCVHTVEHIQSVQYFAHSFTTCLVLNTIASYELEVLQYPPYSPDLTPQ